MVAETGALRGRRRVGQMIDFVNNFKPAGASHFAEACRRFALTHRQKGVCVVLSDFFVKEGFEAGLRYVAGGKYDLFCVQVLSPQEIEPDLQGDLKLQGHRGRRHGGGVDYPAADRAVQEEFERVLPEPEGLSHGGAAGRTCSPARRCRLIRWF